MKARATAVKNFFFEGVATIAYAKRRCARRAQSSARLLCWLRRSRTTCPTTPSCGRRAQRARPAVLQLCQHGQQGVQRSRSEALAARSIPAGFRVGLIRVVLERHLQCQCETAEGVPDILRRQRQIDGGVLVGRIAMNVLKVWARALERGAEHA